MTADAGTQPVACRLGVCHVASYQSLPLILAEFDVNVSGKFAPRWTCAGPAPLDEAARATAVVVHAALATGAEIVGEGLGVLGDGLGKITDAGLDGLGELAGIEAVAPGAEDAGAFEPQARHAHTRTAMRHAYRRRIFTLDPDR